MSDPIQPRVDTIDAAILSLLKTQAKIEELQPQYERAVVARDDALLEARKYLTQSALSEFVGLPTSTIKSLESLARARQGREKAAANRAAKKAMAAEGWVTDGDNDEDQGTGAA